MNLEVANRHTPFLAFFFSVSSSDDADSTPVEDVSTGLERPIAGQHTKMNLVKTHETQRETLQQGKVLVSNRKV